MERIARVITTHPRQIIAITALISLASIVSLFGLRLNADVASFILEGNETGEAFAALQDKYDAGDPITVLAEADDGDFGEISNLVLLTELRDRFAGFEGVAGVGSLVPDQNPLSGQPLTPDAIAGLPDVAVSQLLASNPLVDLLVNEDRDATLLVVTPSDDGVALARDLADLDPPEGLTVTLAGNPVVFASVLDLLGWFLLVIPPVVIVLLLGTFYATIGDRRLTGLAVVPAVLGSLWTFGTVVALGVDIDLVTVIVPIFVIVMGSADGLHFVTHYQLEAERTDDVVERVTSALRHVGIPMILTTISTAAGFLSLLFTDVGPIRQLGGFVALGITYAGIISFFFLPALLSRLTNIKQAHHALVGPRVTRGLQAMARSRGLAIGLTVAILGFGAAFIPRLEVNSDQLFFFKDDHEVRLAFERIEETFGGATPLVGEFVWSPDRGPEDLGRLAEVSRELEQLSGIRRVFSVADLAGVLPSPQVAGVLTGAVPVPLGDMVSDDGLRFVVFPDEFDSTDVAGWVEFADTNDEIAQLTGMPILWDEVARLVLRAQVGSLIAAFALVALMLAISYRRLRPTLASLVPIALTVVMLLGFIAASGIHLNLITAIVSGIVIGVGIDYTIHFVAAHQEARRDRDPTHTAIERVGRPIAANALGVALGLTALWLSPLKPHSHVSLIMWVSMITAAVTAMTVLPRLLGRHPEV